MERVLKVRCRDASSFWLDDAITRLINLCQNMTVYYYASLLLIFSCFSGQCNVASQQFVGNVLCVKKNDDDIFSPVWI